MVYLKDLQTQWPWNPNAEDFRDKEIYTSRINIEDASTSWRIVLLSPMAGYAYTGIRVTVFGKDTEYTIVPRLVQGGTEREVFGLPWDRSVTTNGAWTPLGFPLTQRMISLAENGLDILIEHDDVCWGKVEFVAQRFDDILENEEEISYIFLNHRTDKAEWILTGETMFYKPNPHEQPVYRRRSKLIPSISRLLNQQRNAWMDTSVSWNEVNLFAPLLVPNLNRVDG